MGHIDSQYTNAQATSGKRTCFNSNSETWANSLRKELIGNLEDDLTNLNLEDEGKGCMIIQLNKFNFE
jgi:hypothetical protein